MADWNRWIANAVIASTLTLVSAWGQTTNYSALRTQGRAQYQVGGFAEAERLLRDALEAATAAGDREMAATINRDLGDVYSGEQRLNEAELAYNRSLAVLRGMSGKDFETAVAFRNLGSVYTHQHRYEEALRALDQATKLLTGHVEQRETDALRAEILNTKGTIFLFQQRVGKAQGLFQQAVQLRAAAGISGGIGDAHTFNNIATVYLKQRRYRQAEQFFKDALDIMARVLGPSHPDMTITMATLGEMYMQTGRYAEAMDQYQRSLAISRAVIPPQNGLIARTLELVSLTYLKQGDRTNAETTLAEALDLARRLNAAENPGIPGVLESSADLLKRLGKADEEREVRAEAKRIRVATALTVRAPSNH